MRCSSSSAVQLSSSVCLAGGQLWVGLDDRHLGYSSWQTELEVQMRRADPGTRIKSTQQNRAARASRAMQAGYVSRRRIQVRSREIHNGDHEAQLPDLLDQNGDRPRRMVVFLLATGSSQLERLK